MLFFNFNGTTFIKITLRQLDIVCLETFIKNVSKKTKRKCN